MSGIASAAVALGATLGVILSAYAAWRAAKQDRTKESSDSAAVLLGGWETFHATTRQQIADLQAEHETGRKIWDKERARLQSEIEALRAEVAIWIRRVNP